jgi:hypothetical protein
VKKPWMMDLPQSILQGIKCPHHMLDQVCGLDIFAEESRLAAGVSVIFVESMGQLWIDFYVGDMDNEFKKSKKGK